MSFDVSLLSAYVANSNPKQYALKAVSDSAFAKSLIDSGNVQLGLKGKDRLLSFNNNIVLVDAACSRTESGSIDLSEKEIECKRHATYESICTETIHNTAYSEALKKGNVPQEEIIPELANAIINDRMKKLAEINEVVLFQGDASLTGSTNLKRINGVLKQITYNATSAATGTTIVEKLQNLFLNFDATVRNQEDFVIYVSKEIFNEYTIALANKNIFKPVEDKTLFGTSCRIEAYSGLNGQRKVFGSRQSNLRLALDGINDWDTMVFKHSEETDKWYLDTKYGMGILVIFTTEAKYATV